MMRTAKKGETCEIALTTFALAYSLLAGQKNQYDKQEELFFQKAPLQALILYAPDDTAF